MGLATSLIAWSGLLLAEGAGRVEDDTGASTPRHHAPRRATPKKRNAPKTKGGKKANLAPDAATVVAPSTFAPCATPSSDAGIDGASPGASGVPHASGDRDEEEDDEDEDEDGGASNADAAPRPRAKRQHPDGGADAAPDAGEDDDEGDDDDNDAGDEADDTAYELGLELATESRLVWRGLPESRGAVLQTSGWAGFYGLSVEGWASYVLNREGPFDPMSVVGADLTASYAFSIGDLRIRPAVTLLYFPEGLSSSTTAEASLGASYRMGDFHVVSGTNFDMVLEPGAYFGTLGATWGHAKAPWTVKALVDVGWATGRYNFEYLGKNVAAFDVVHAGGSARYDLGSVVYLELHIDASTLIAPALRGSLQEPTLIVGGAAIGLDWSVGR